MTPNDRTVLKRTMLLKILMDRKVSMPTQLMISRRMTNYAPEDHKGREAEAERVIEIMDSSATEELIVERLKNLE